MSDKKVENGEPAMWLGTDTEAPVHLVPVSSQKRLEVNGAPIDQLSHVYVVRKRKPDAED